jgi:hypothetical protein
MSASEGLTEASGFTRAQVIKRGLVAGVAIGASGLLAGRARGATRASETRHIADGWGSSRVRVAREHLYDLRRRLSDTRLPSMELVDDASQGVQLATMQALRGYWATGYDWRAFEASLNALPQFRTELDGVGIHFIHVRSAHENALPLIITHGWPGSFVEMLGVIGPLTDPTAYGGTADDAFDVVVPSIPGFGFSDAPTSLGWGPGRVAQAWAQLMSSLGYTRYVAQGRRRRRCHGRDGHPSAERAGWNSPQLPQKATDKHLPGTPRPRARPTSHGRREGRVHGVRSPAEKGLQRRADPVAGDHRLLADRLAYRAGKLDARPRR